MKTEKGRVSVSPLSEQEAPRSTAGQSCWRTGFFPPQDTTANSSFCRARGASHGLEHYHTRSIMSSLGRPVSGRDLHWTKDDVGSEFSKADLWASWEEKPRLRPRAPGPQR